MVIFEETETFSALERGCVATIGKFDGVHLGHQVILQQLKEKATRFKLPAVVILIEPHPEEFFADRLIESPARLSTFEEKIGLLETLGIGYVYKMRFDHELSQLRPENYITNILVGGLGIHDFIVGKDFRFGHRREGDFNLLKEYGSPLFTLSEKKIRENYRSAKRIFETRYPKVQFAWSYKTNYLNAVCKVFHQEGSWGEVVSRFEYDKAVKNGVPTDKIIFNGPDKTDDDLTTAVQNNSPIHIDHLDELYRLTDIATELNKKPRVAIRVNMDTGIYPMWDRFGFNLENGQAWDAINKIMAAGKLNLVGLHCHIGTFMLSANAYHVAATKKADLALKLKISTRKSSRT